MFVADANLRKNDATQVIGKQLYENGAKEMATNRIKLTDDGDHFNFAFEGKKNTIWYGALRPLSDCRIHFISCSSTRKTYTKSYWNAGDFNAFIAPLYTYITDTPTRVLLDDGVWGEYFMELPDAKFSPGGSYFIYVINVAEINN
jgi:hypothetical protein